MVGNTKKKSIGSTDSKTAHRKTRSYFTIMVVALVILSLVEFIPLLAAVLFNYNYGASQLGIFHQYLNEKIRLAYISWFAFDILMIMTIVFIIRSSMHVVSKVILVCTILLFMYICMYSFLHIANTIFACVFRNPPFIQDRYAKFPYARVLEDNCKIIRNEFSRRYEQSDCIDKSIPGFQISTGTPDKCWRTVILKKQGHIDEYAMKKYPETTKLLDDPSIHNAIFSILDGNVSIPPHTGYYKGYLRYHLGVEIPEENGRSASIMCGGDEYKWKNCEGVLFDDMYIHSVTNPTSKRRVVLYLDVIRNDVPRFLKPVYDFTNWYIETHPIVRHLVKLQHTHQKNKELSQNT